MSKTSNTWKVQELAEKLDKSEKRITYLEGHLKYLENYRVDANKQIAKLRAKLNDMQQRVIEASLSFYDDGEQQDRIDRAKDMQEELKR